ncbi:hypothetical protein TNCV_4918451 [Trichonephila clavipes]|nr:hypothetical protein TNCV_4918451 [Trichonephila clavipes]
MSALTFPNEFFKPPWFHRRRAGGHCYRDPISYAAQRSYSFKWERQSRTIRESNSRYFSNEQKNDGAVRTLVSDFKVHRTRGDKDQ